TELQINLLRLFHRSSPLFVEGRPTHVDLAAENFEQGQRPVRQPGVPGERTCFCKVKFTANALALQEESMERMAWITALESAVVGGFSPDLLCFRALIPRRRQRDRHGAGGAKARRAHRNPAVKAVLIVDRPWLPAEGKFTLGVQVTGIARPLT